MGFLFADAVVLAAPVADVLGVRRRRGWDRGAASAPPAEDADGSDYQKQENFEHGSSVHRGHQRAVDVGVAEGKALRGEPGGNDALAGQQRPGEFAQRQA